MTKDADMAALQIYQVRSVWQPRVSQPALYLLQDLNGKHTVGSYYRAELYKTKPVEKNEPFTISRVIKEEKRNNKMYSLISFLGYPASYNMWIPKADIITKDSKAKK